MTQPGPVKLFAAVLAAGDRFWGSLELDLTAVFGAVDLTSPALAWSASAYYEKEMGTGLRRKLFSFGRLRSPAALAEWKHRTRSLENAYRDEATHRRRVNIDPGYLEAGKVILASTKNANHRIYLRSGIYGEATLAYVGARFLPYEYTYPDYQWPEVEEFFGCVRRRYLEQLRERRAVQPDTKR